MANDTDFNIVIGAEADKDSAKKAVKDISKAVDSSVKGGRIEIPIDITVPIDKNKDKLTKAQQAVATKISKMTAKGFSASGKDIDALTSKFNEFVKAFDQAGKGRQNKVFKEIRKQVEDLQKVYNASKPVKVTSTNKQKKGYSKRAIDAAKREWENEIKAKDIKRTNKREDAKFIKDLTKGAGRGKASTPGSDTNIGVRTSSNDRTYLDKEKILANDKLGTYYGKNSLMKQMAETEKINRKQPVDYKRVSVEEANRMAQEALAKGGNKNNLSPVEKAKGLSRAILPQLAEILGGIEKGRPDVSQDDFFKKLEAIFTLNKQTGEKTMNAVTSTLNMTLHKYFNADGVIGATDGEDKAAGSRNAQVVKVLKEFLNKIEKLQDKISKETIAIEKAYEKEQKVTKTTKSKKSTEADSIINRFVDKLSTDNAKQLKEQQTQNDAITKQTQLDTIEHDAERVADSKAGENSRLLNEIEKTDAEDGFNSEANAQELLSKFSTLKNVFSECPCESILQAILSNVKILVDIFSGKNEPEKQEKIGNWNSALPTLIPGEEARTLKRAGRPKKIRRFIDKTDDQALRQKMAAAAIERERELIEQGKHPSQQKNQDTQVSKDISTLSNVFSSIKSVFRTNANFGPNADAIMAMSEEEQRKLQAQLIEKYGLTRQEGDPTSTRDKAQMYRRKTLYGWGKDTTNPFANLQLTEGMKINTKGITEALQKAVQRNMFNAQTGGLFNNLIGPMTLYAGQPSLEKSRAEIDALNTVMANLRDVILTLLQSIQSKELQLGGLEESGKAKFNADGTLASGSSNEAITIFAELEQQKESLTGVLAEVAKIDNVSAELDYKAHDILKVLGFVNPLLKDNNKIIQNVNAGLDKNGKALKFQTRTGEILNYSFQLMGRHIGQMIKRWMLMLNPINLIKKAFQDFASYDVKWQRTMNVIKYNFRRIIRPAMQWIAQQIVNIIGLVNALIKGIGKAFGKDWDLFDKEAADAEKMREELEAAANVTAGFDELHDIGGDSGNPAMDFLSEDSDIYTPQWDSLYQGIQEFGERVATVFKTIYDTVSGWNFWDWLAVGAGVVAGILVFKWILDLFNKGKNPLQSVADGFKVLEELAGLALVIASIALLTEALKDFIEVVGQMESKQVTQALAALGIALGIVGLVILALLIALAAVISTGVGALAVVGLAAIVAAIALVIAAIALLTYAISDLVETIAEHAVQISMLMMTAGMIVISIIRTIGETLQNIIQTVGATIAQIIMTVIIGIQTTIITIGATIVNVIQGIANAIMTVLQPIMDFIDRIIGRIVDLATTIAHEIGDTIRTIIETVGEIIMNIIDSITNAIPNLLHSILTFCHDIGPAIENSVDAICRSVTKLVNFVVSAVEYMANTIVGALNAINVQVPDWVPIFGGKRFGFNLQKVEIQRFVPRYEKGTNYVPNDGLAYLHQGEAVVPKKYNQPYNQGLSNEERAYMQQMMTTMKSLDGTMKQGIAVNGQFVQRGSDLVAVVNKTKSQTGADLLSNVSYAR